MKHYIEDFIKLKCASELLAWKLFPNAKEITESFAAFHGVINMIMPKMNSQTNPISYNSENVKLISIADGYTPRTAALFALRTKWDCYSIDPVLRMNEYPIKRLTQINKKIEEVNLNFENDIIIIVSVHGHATINNMLEHIHGKERYLLVIPCCVPQDIPNRPYIGFLDTNIWSDKKLVKVWLNI